jgi:hypothetical protein
MLSYVKWRPRSAEFISSNLRLFDLCHSLHHPKYVIESQQLKPRAFTDSEIAVMSSYLGIEGCHAFVTGARGGIGSAIVQELIGILHIRSCGIEPKLLIPD